LQFLPAKSQASLAPLGNHVDKEMSRLKPDSELETTRFRQAVYIKFTKRNHMPNPCSSKPGYKRIVACFIERLMVDQNSWSTTVHGYAESINTLFQLRNLPALANLSDQTNMCARIILLREKEEDIAKQQSPITREMFAALCNLAKKASADLLEAVVADWFKFIRNTGLRCAEYAQKTQSVFDKHKYPSGKCVVKAFIPTDWTFYNSSSAIMNIHPLTSLVQVFPVRLKVTYQIQKNRQNGQCITLVANNDHPDICPVRVAYRIFLRAKKLGQLDSQPMAVFVKKHGIKKSLQVKRYPMSCNPLQGQSTRIVLKMQSSIFPLTRVGFGH
jgi:hypothetical protein